MKLLRRLLDGLRQRPKSAAAVAGTGMAFAAVLTLNVGTPSGVCEAPTCFPDATNTGVPSGRTLATVSGNVTLSTLGQTYEDKIVNGCISVTASNVTIRYVRVNCHSSNSIETGSDFGGATGLVVEYSEIDCNGIDDDSAGRTAITNSNYTLRYSDIYGGCDNGVWCDASCTINDNYVHEIVPCDVGTYQCGRDCIDPPHTDGLQGGGGANNITVRHNTVYGHYERKDDPSTSDGDDICSPPNLETDNEASFGNAAANIAGGTPGATNLTYEDNLFAGGGYTLYCSGVPSATNTYTGNRFSTVFTAADIYASVNDVGGFAPTYPSCDSEPNFDATNVYHDGPDAGDPVP